jgi:predicted RNA-binding Zn ribbon-like protein
MTGYSDDTAVPTASTMGALGRREPAPGGLELVRAFINSADVEAGTDLLGTTAGMGEWLRERDLPGASDPIGADDHTTALAVREALRDLITEDASGRISDRATRILADAARVSPLRVAFNGNGGTALQPVGSGVPALVARILAEVVLADVAGTWSRLKICRNDACRWAFYDTSRNHAGVWCSMAICGNRAKGRAYRGRQVGRRT